MASNIGAGARVYLGSPSVPVLPFTTGQPTTTPSTGQVALYGVADNLTAVNINTTEGTVDITKLTADKDAYFRRHIAGLLDADGSGKYGELDEAGTFQRRIFGLKAGVLHPNGRGKADIIVRPHGDGAGKIQYRGVVSFPSMGLAVETETEIGGDISYKFDGQIILELQA